MHGQQNIKISTYSWFYCKKFNTLYGHMNVKNVTIFVRYRKGSLVYFKLYN